MRGWDGKKYYEREKILKNSISSTGYEKIDLKKNGVRKSFKVHRLVAFSFIPIIDGKTIINHLDGNPLNNNYKNLEWCTQKENVNHAINTGLIKTFFISKEDLKYLYSEKNMTICEIAKLKKTSIKSLKKYFEKYNLDLRKTGYHLDKYHIDLDILSKELKDGKTNKELAKKYSCNSNLIARRKYQLKKKGIL